MNLPLVKNIIPVASGKGGVGKSTVSVNLALALAKTGAKVGIMDADVYGPSIPTLLGITESPESSGERVLPVTKYGIKVISTAFFMPPNEAVIWRGPMLNKMIHDFLSIVDWGELDYLIVDLPPGTGDVQLSLCQSIALTGAVIVSTPQDVAWNIAQKAIVMFDKLNTPVLGIIENMSRYVCAHCGDTAEIFGRGGAEAAAKNLEIPFLGDIPLVKSIRASSDGGDPIVHSDLGSPSAKKFIEITASLLRELEKRRAEGNKKIEPLQIGGVDEAEISILWNDGKSSVFQARELRLLCPCAACVNEISGERTLKPEMVPPDIAAVEISKVGRYALHIEWSDGHDTGLYGFEFLRKLNYAWPKTG